LFGPPSVRRRRDERRAAPERRGRRRRVDRPCRPAAVAGDAGTGRGSHARGEDGSKGRLTRTIQLRVALVEEPVAISAKPVIPTPGQARGRLIAGTPGSEPGGKRGDPG